MDSIEGKRNEYTERIIAEIKELLTKSRKSVALQVNNELLSTYWKIGEIIVRYEQNEQIRAAYGEKTLRHFSRELTREIGKGFSLSNIYNMRQFYIIYPIFQSVTGKLTWTHYCEFYRFRTMIKGIFMRRSVLIPVGQ